MPTEHCQRSESGLVQMTTERERHKTALDGRSAPLVGQVKVEILSIHRRGVARELQVVPKIKRLFVSVKLW